MKSPFDSNGYILHEDDKRVVIATGFTTKSSNAKTGNMVQIWILVRGENPLQAIESGADAAVCGTCPLRGTQGKKRACYVNLGQAPLGIWRTYQRGRYAFLQQDAYPMMFSGRAVRFGAYGDPVFIPFHIVYAIAAIARKHTGYTHQWANPLYTNYKSFLMASADSENLADAAQRKGWRTFRVAPMGQMQVGAREIVCVNTTRGITCEQCGLCNGSTGAKSIVIEAHGAGKVHIS